MLELAAGGMNILLLSRNKDQLDAISSYVGGLHSLVEVFLYI